MSAAHRWFVGQAMKLSRPTQSRGDMRSGRSWCWKGFLLDPAVRFGHEPFDGNASPPGHLDGLLVLTTLRDPQADRWRRVP